MAPPAVDTQTAGESSRSGHVTLLLMLSRHYLRRYGPIGQPIQGLPPPGAGARPSGPAQRKASRKAAAPAGGKRADISEFCDEFSALLVREMPCERLAPRDIAVVDAKSANATNGLETSTFTVCTRIRPALGQENHRSSENLVCVVPGNRVGRGSDHCEEALVLKPAVSLQGTPKISKTAATFDYVFGPEDTNGTIHATRSIICCSSKLAISNILAALSHCTSTLQAMSSKLWEHRSSRAPRRVWSAWFSPTDRLGLARLTR